jgi:type IV secretion system protein VirD4
MTKEKYNFYNFYKIINIKDGGDAPYETLKRYFRNRSKSFNIQELSNDVTSASETTASSFLATLNPNIGLFADPGIAFLTSGTDINFRSFIEKPTAYYIRIPDAKETMHKIATIAVEQLYKTLVEFSDSDPSLAMPRPTYFVLDEFANLPKIEKMGTYVAVSRSRKIYWLLVLQDYTQLETKYEKAGASTIKNNCNVHIFIGSGDMATLKDVSDRTGKKVVTVEDKSTSKGSKEDSSSTSTSKKEQERPLVFVEELQQLPQETMLVLFDKHPAFYTKLQGSWKSQGVFNLNKTQDSFKPARYLDPSIGYNIMGYLDYDRRGGASANTGAPSGMGGGGMPQGGGSGSKFSDFDFDF